MKTVAFAGACSARSSAVLVCPRISHAYAIKRIRASFAVGSNFLLLLRFYYSPDNDAPSSGAPNGQNLLSDYGHVDYIVGNDEDVNLEHEVEVAEQGSFLKVYAVNNDYYDHMVNVQMFIEPIERR